MSYSGAATGAQIADFVYHASGSGVQSSEYAAEPAKPSADSEHEVGAA